MSLPFELCVHSPSIEAPRRGFEALVLVAAHPLLQHLRKGARPDEVLTATNVDFLLEQLGLQFGLARLSHLAG